MKKNLSLLIVMIMIVLSVGVRVEAAVVSTTFDTRTQPLISEDWKYFRVAKLLGNISITVYKTINFKLPDSTIAGNQSTLNIGHHYR
jgi:ribosomal protein S19E (S16A)